MPADVVSYGPSFHLSMYPSVLPSILCFIFLLVLSLMALASIISHDSCSDSFILFPALCLHFIVGLVPFEIFSKYSSYFLPYSVRLSHIFIARLSSVVVFLSNLSALSTPTTPARGGKTNKLFYRHSLFLLFVWFLF